MTINRSAKIKATKLHNAEHLIIQKKAAGHKPEYYYYMACQLIEDLKKEMKEISKQQKYLWQTVSEVIEELKAIRSSHKERKANGK